MIYIPRMHMSGNSEGTIKNTFSFIVNAVIRLNSVFFLFLIYAKTARIIVAPLNEIRRGAVDKGFVRPRANSTLFNRRPKSIEKAILNPTESTIFSAQPRLFSFSINIKRKPGIKVK